MNDTHSNNKHGSPGRRFPFRGKPAKIAFTRTRRLRLEQLEDRRLLSANITYKIANYPVDQTDVVHGGTVTVSGTIETDGTLGTLTAANIVAASLNINSTSGTNIAWQFEYGSPGLQATSTQLLLPDGGAFYIAGNTSYPHVDIYYANDYFGVSSTYEGGSNGPDGVNYAEFGGSQNPIIQGGAGSILANNPWIIASVSIWTGAGSNDLWSNPDNWVGNIAPVAGDSLLFPSSAAQQTNVDDLGYTFDSVTFQGGNYTISGQTLTTTGTLDFQAGSTELDCSTTTGGPTTIEEGASLAIGGGRTLNVLSTDAFVDGGTLSLLAGSNSDFNGDMSVLNTGILDAATGSGGILNSRKDLFNGIETFAEGSNLTQGVADNLEVGAGMLGLDGIGNLSGKVTVNKSGSLEAGSASQIINEDGSETDVYGNVTVAKGGNLTASGGATFINEDGSETDVYGNVTVAKGGNLTASGGATFINEDGSETDVYGNVTVAKGGNLTASGGATIINEDGSEIDVYGNVTVAKGGNLTASGGATIINEDGSETDVYGNVTVDHGAQVTAGVRSTTSLQNGGTLGVYGTYSTNGTLRRGGQHHNNCARPRYLRNRAWWKVRAGKGRVRNCYSSAHSLRIGTTSPSRPELASK